jgi:hypothetical protein
MPDVFEGRSDISHSMFKCGCRELKSESAVAQSHFRELNHAQDFVCLLEPAGQGSYSWFERLAKRD